MTTKKQVIDMILTWWNEHKYDTFGTADDEYNVYNEEPPFVTWAKTERGIKND